MNFVTGDTHGFLDLHKLSSERWPLGKTLTKDDNLIILGDFGLLWDNSKEEVYWRDWLGSKPWTTIVIWGNHENFDMVKTLGTDTKFGGPVQLIRTRGGYIYALKNGCIYNINGETFFVMGGATSIDKHLRKPGTEWWPEELPTNEDWERAYASLDAVDWKVDYVLTHTLPAHYVRYVTGDIFDSKGMDPVALKLQDIYDTFYAKGNFKRWFFGHMHTDAWVPHNYTGDRKLFALYETIMGVE